MQLNSGEINEPIKKMGQRIKQIFLQRHTDGQERHEETLNITTSLIIGEMHIKTAMRYHLTPIRMAAVKMSTVNAGEAVEKSEPSYTVGGNITSTTTMENSVEISLKTGNRTAI